jgi:antibiotic biosynthesis monooxygenase
MTFTYRHPLVAGLALAAIIWSPALLLGRPQEGPPATTQQTGGFPDLVSGLKATPGCLGVETARTASGKAVIFAWFENKQAVLNWYNSPMHQALLNQYSGGHRRPGGPLAGVPDEGPVLAVASLTMAKPPADGDLRAATTQIAIELYAPLPGGLASGGRFAPSSVKVPGLIEVPSSPR